MSQMHSLGLIKHPSLLFEDRRGQHPVETPDVGSSWTGLGEKTRGWRHAFQRTPPIQTHAKKEIAIHMAKIECVNGDDILTLSDSIPCIQLHP